MNLRTLIRRRWTAANFKTNATPRTLSHKLPGFDSLEDRLVPAPVATVSGLTNSDVLLGDTASYSFTFTNSASVGAGNTGFAPFVELAVDTSGPDGGGTPDGYGTPTLSVAGLPLSTAGAPVLLNAANILAGTYTNPFTGQARPIPADIGLGDTIYVYQLPFGSFTPGQFTQGTISIPTSNLADLDSPLPIRLTGGFLDNEPALNGPPVYGNTDDGSVNPQLYTLRKVYVGPESETATGPNYVRQYRLEIDVATGQTLTNLQVTDILANSMQLVGRNTTVVQGSPNIHAEIDGVDVTDLSDLVTTDGAASGGGTTPDAPGGTVRYNFGTVVGEAGVDATFTFNFFVPRLDSGGAETVPQGTSSTTATNTSDATADWVPLDIRDVPLTGVEPSATLSELDHTLEQQSLAVQKTFAPYAMNGTTPATTIRPGQTLLRYELDFQVSDYFALQNLTLQDLLGDGQRLYLGASGTGTGGDALFMPTLSVQNAFEIPGTRTNTSGVFTSTGSIRYRQLYTSNAASNPTGYAVDGPEASNAVFDNLAANVPVPVGMGAFDYANPYAGDTFLQFNISQELIARLGSDAGRLVGGEIDNTTGLPYGNHPETPPYRPATRGTIVFYAIVTQEYSDSFRTQAGGSGDPSVDQGDVLANSNPVTNSAAALAANEGQPFTGIRGDQIATTNLNNPGAPVIGVASTDDTGTSAIIPRGDQSKQVYAINGRVISPQTPADTVFSVQAGDLITYQLTYTLPISRFEDLQILDIAPLPVMPVGPFSGYTFDRTFDGVSGGFISVGAYQIEVGPDDTFFSTFAGFADLTPSATPGVGNITTDANTNTITMDFGDFDDPMDRFTTISLLVTLPVGNDPFSADLFLTNQLRVNEGSTNQGQTTVEDLRRFQLVRPQVNIQKGAVGSNNVGLTTADSNIVFAPASNANGTFTIGGQQFQAGTTNPLDTSGEAGQIGGLNITQTNSPTDAGDTVRYAIVAQNVGRGDAFNVRIRDVIPAEYVRPADISGLNLRLYRGDGTLMVAGVDYTIVSYDSGTGEFVLELVDNYTSGNVNVGNPATLAPDDRSGGLSRGQAAQAASQTGAGTPITNGSNTVVALYDLVVAGTVAPNQLIENTATIPSYSSSETGPDLTDPTQVPGATDPTDDADVRIKLPLQSKSFDSTEIVNAVNSNTQAAIGELITYTVTVRIPEGTTAGASITDNLEAGLAFVGITNVQVSSGITTTTGLTNAGNGLTNVAIQSLAANLVVSNNGRTVRFDLDGITNSNTDNSIFETIIITYQAVVLNTNGATDNATNDNDNQSGQLRQNSADFNWTNGFNLQSVGAGQSTGTNGNRSGTLQEVEIVEPTLTNVKDVSVSSAGSEPYTPYAQQARADAGDSIRYRIRITNPNSGSTRAYGVTLADALPVGAFMGPNPFGTQPFSVTVTAADGSLVGVGNIYRNGVIATLGVGDFVIDGAGNLTLNPANTYDFDPNVRIDIVVQANNYLGSTGAFVTNTADVRWTSLPGDVNTPRSTFNTNSVERTGADGEIGSGALNDYRDTDNALIESPPLVHKSIVETSEPYTVPFAPITPAYGVTNVDGAIGELVRYRLYVSVPETSAGNPLVNFQIQDFLPTGTMFLNDDSARYLFVGTSPNPFTSTGVSNAAFFNGSSAALVSTVGIAGIDYITSASLVGVFGDANISNNATTDDDTYGSGTDVFFKFGDLTNQNNDADLEFLVLEFNVLVLNETGNQNGTNLNNNFGVRLDIGGTPTAINVVQDGGASGTPDGLYSPDDVGSTVSNNATIAVVEPNLTVNKRVTATTGNTVTYTVTVTNNGTATAFGVVIQDDVNNPAEGLTLVSVDGLADFIYTGGASGGTDLSNVGAGLVRFDSSGPDPADQLVIPVDGSVTFTYVANVTLIPTGTDSIDNTVNVTYESLDGNGSLITNTTVNPRGTAGTSTGERTGQDGPGGLNDYVTSDTERLGSLGDRVYFDADGDGVQDLGEAGIVGVEVVVRWAGPNGSFDGDDQFITATTGANGIWHVTGLPLGASQFYRISVPATLSGMNVTDVGDNGGAANPNPFGLGVGVSAITLTGVDEATTNNRIQDFGYRGTASLGDRVYVDADGDGVQDLNGLEPSLPGVEVVLTWGGLDGIVGGGNAADDLTFTVTSSAVPGTGPNYLFSNLPAGNYTVAVSTTGGVGGVPLNSILTDSVNDGTLTPTGTVPATLTLGQAADVYDFGYQGNASFGDYVWYDVDGDGVQDSNEPPIAGAVVTAVWFGPNGTVGGGDDVTFTTTTDSAGNYLFPGIPANALSGLNPNYSVTVTPPAAYPTLTDSINDGSLNATNPVDIQVSPVNGDALNDRTDVDFGFRGTASLGNFVWHDLNGNGVQDGGEPGINGVTVQLFFDSNNDGDFNDPGENIPIATVTTSTTGVFTGQYRFGNLAAGNYEIVFGDTAGATTYTRTFPNSSAATDDTVDSDADRTTGRTGTYTLANGASNITVDAGLFIPISLGDRVWYDVDGDGVQDLTNEPGIEDVPITVVWLGVDGVAGGTGDAADVTFSTTTGANGIWSIGNLPPGEYTVTAGTPPNGLTTLTDSINNGGAPSPVNPVTITAVSGVDRDDIDFGFIGTSSLGDRVWLDVDGDGVQDANGLEPGIPGLPVTLVWFGQDGLEGTTTDNVTLTTVTGADGIYGFPNLPTGAYRVTVNPAPGISSNLVPTYDLDSTTVAPDGTTVATIPNPGDDITNVDFGYRGNASVGDRVWIDQNQDGIQDPFEPGIVGAVIELVSGGVDNDLGTPVDNFTMTVTTGANGEYLFNGVPVFNGSTPYQATVITLPVPGFTPTYDLDDGTTAPDGLAVFDVTDTGGAAPSTQNRRDVDFGYDGGGTLSGTVYRDDNNNGIQGIGEPGIAGVTIVLTGTDSLGNPVLDPLTGLPYQAITDANGNYIFNNVVPGTYRITETQPAAYNDGIDTLGSISTPAADPFDNGTADNDTFFDILFPAEGTGVEYNFGEIGTFVSGTVFRDSDRSGAQNGTEPGIAGVVVVLTGGPDNITRTAVTDQNGFYIFPNIPAGTGYVVTEYGADTSQPNPVGYADTPNDGSGFANNVKNLPEVPLSGLINQNYGEVLGSLSGVVYLDRNNNGSQQTGEPGLSGVTVVLTGTDAAGAAVNRTALTDSTGAYTFDNLLEGTYTIVEFQPTRYADGLDGQNNATGTAGSLGGTIGNDVLTAVTLPAGGAGVNYNFGETPPITLPNTSSLSGTVWLDLDKDGSIDPNETGIPGVVVTLTGPGGISLTTTTGPDGSYLFTNLPAGSYTVTETQPPEYGTTTPNVVNATIPPTLVPVTGVDFGEAPGTIAGTVYIDFDDSGTREASEPPIAGVVVTLTDSVGTTIAVTTTDEFGNYRFTGLPAGTYTVTQTQPPAFVSGPDNASGTLGGTANGPNEFETIVVPPGGDGTEYNFGENNPSAAGTTFISGTVWLDRNRDGVFDPTEQGIPGVLVELLDADGNVIDTTTTGSDGSYTFLDVVPGTYTVRERELTDPALAPWGSSTPDDIPVFVPPSLVPVTGLNFGETPAAIAGSTYLDADNDGVRDPGEFGIGGVTVVLVGTDVNGNPVERTTTTNPAGFYQFDDLPASDTDGYTVTQTQPLGYQDGLDGQDNGAGTAGSLGGVINDDVLTTIVVPAGEIGNQYNFGERGPNSVSGFVYLDYDLSGDFDPTGQDVPFGGGSVTLNNGNTTAQPAITLTTPPFLVVLTGVDAQGNLINLSTITAPDGSYSFGNLPAGTYTIYQSIPITPILVNDTMISGLYNGLDTLGSLGGTNANSMDNELGVTLTGDGSVANPAQNGTDYNFGELPPADPFGFVYVDENANGVLDAGEPGIAGVPITISGIAFAGTPFARPLTAADVPGGSLTIFTDANGRWEFVPIPPGLYTIVQSAQPAGFFDGVEQNADPNGQPGGPVVVGNDVFSNINVQPFPIRGPFNFGELRPSSISGTVYQDLNRNGVRDAGEPGIGGVQMTLTGTVASLPGINPGQRGAGVGPTIVFTDANGNFTFGGLLPGTYALAEAQPIPFAQGTNAPGSSGGIFLGTDIIGLINLGPGVNAVNYLFGEVNPLGTNPEPVPPVGPLPPVTSIAPGTPTKRSFLASTPYSDGTERVDPNYAALGSLGAPGANQFLSTADGVGGELVRVFDLTRGVERFRLRPFPGNPGGTRAVQGDITGDGVPDTVAVPAAGGTPRVVVYDGNNAAIRSSFFAFEESFTGGLFVATGDLNNDGFDDIVVSADVGGGPRVKVFDGRTGSLLADFWGIEDPNFRGGARIAIGDVNGDGQLDLIVAAGVGGGPRVSIFDGASVIAGNPTRLVADFYAFEQTLTNGVYISAGDVNGDGFADLAFGAGPGGAPRVTGIDGSSLIAGRITPVFDFFVGDANARGGVPVHLQDIDNDGRSELITGTAAGQTSLVKIFDVGNGPGRELDEFYANWKDFLGGVFVG